MIPITYNLRSLSVRKATTLASVFGIALVVFVLASSQMLASGIRNTMGKSGNADRALVLRKGADAEMQSNISAPLVSLILSQPQVKKDGSGKPLGVGELLFILVLERLGKPGQISSITLRGIADDTLGYRPEIHVVSGRAFHPGSDEVIIGKRLEGQFDGMKLGGSFEAKKNRRVTVVGVFEAAGSSHESEMIGDIELVRSSFGLNGVVSSITVTLDDRTHFDAFKAAIESDKRLGLTAFREPEYYEKQSDGTVQLVAGLGGAVAFLFSIGATIGAMITMYGGVARRKREIGTLRALGFSRFNVLSSFLLEGVLLSVVGGAIGTIASLATRFLRFSLMNLSSGSEIAFSFDPSPSIALWAVLVGGVMGVFGGLLPALQAARISPTVAMRS
jgi:putative ABC transport system permease protein